MSVKQPTVYKELLLEYFSAFHVLTSYLRNGGNGKVMLNVFTPQQCMDLEGINLQPVYVEVTTKSMCFEILVNVTRFFNMILRDCLIFYIMHGALCQALKDLEYLLAESETPLKIKINIMEVYVSSVLSLQNTLFPLQIEEKLQQVPNYIEHAVYNIYNNSTYVSEQEMQYFEKLLIKFLINNKQKAVNKRIFNFLCNKICSKNQVKPSKQVVQTACAGVCNIDELLASLFNNFNLLCLVPIEGQIILEIKNFHDEMDWNKTVLQKIHNGLDLLLKENIQNNGVQQLELVSGILDLLAKARIVAYNKFGCVKGILNDRMSFNTFLKNLASYVSQKNNFSEELVLKVLSKSAVLCLPDDLQKIFVIISRPLLHQINPNNDAVNRLCNLLLGCNISLTCKYLYHFLCNFCVPGYPMENEEFKKLYVSVMRSLAVKDQGEIVSFYSFNN